MLVFSAVISCLIISVAAKAGNNNKKVPNPSLKRENVFNRTVAHNVSSQEVPGAADFLEYTRKFLDILYNGIKIPAELRNEHFSNGLNQYYLSKAYEYYFANATSTNKSHSDPICMPNATKEGVEFYRVKAYGFPAFKENARSYRKIGGSPFLKNYALYFNATSDVFIVTGYFNISDERYYFVYHTDNNLYTAHINVIRTKDGLLKPKTTDEVFEVQKTTFVHTYDSTQKYYTNVTKSIYPKFRALLQTVYMPLLATAVEENLLPQLHEGDIEFGKLYRERLIKMLLESVKECFLTFEYMSHEFTPQKMTRETIIPGFTAVYTYTVTVDGFLNYERHEFNSSPSVANGTSLFMYDVVTFHYPRHVCNMTVVALDHKNASVIESFEMRSIDIMIAYKANLSSVPIHLGPDPDKWVYLRTGFFTDFKLQGFNSFYDFVKMHAQAQLAQIIAKAFYRDAKSSG